MSTRPHFSSFSEWSAAWLDLARFTGSEVDQPATRIKNLLRLWNADVPGPWERAPDSRLSDPAVRYQRHHKHGAPTLGSEHELEWEILGPDPSKVVTNCFCSRLIDGVNAVPLARDPSGGRTGNVEADMLLLTESPKPELLLVEAKTTSNNAWYAAVENLRQLKLLLASASARAILPRVGPAAVRPAVAAVVLGPVAFYEQAGAKMRSVEPTRQLQAEVGAVLQVDLRLASWDTDKREIAELT